MYVMVVLGGVDCCGLLWVLLFCCWLVCLVG